MILIRWLKMGLYFIRLALANLFRRPLHSTVGVLTLAVSLILVGFLGLFAWKGNDLVQRLSGGLRLTVYLDPGITRMAADELVRVVTEQWPEAEAVDYHTADEDRERNLRMLPPELVEGVDPEMVPAQPYVEVSLKVEGLTDQRVQAMSEWFGTLSHVQGVDDVLFGAEKLAVAFSLVRAGQSLGLFIAAVIVAAALLFVLMTTRLIAADRRREIEVLLLVGATRTFIRLPHYLEGVFQGLAAGLIAYGAVYLLQHKMLTDLRAELLLQVPVDLLPPAMVTWYIGGGAALGLLGAVLGTARYLRFSA